MSTQGYTSKSSCLDLTALRPLCRSRPAPFALGRPGTTLRRHHAKARIYGQAFSQIGCLAMYGATKKGLPNAFERAYR